MMYLLSSGEKVNLELKAEAVLELLGDYGVVSEEIYEKVINTSDLNLLNRWLKLAAKSETMEQFIKEM